MTGYEQHSQLPQVIVVGDQRLADALSASEASWTVFPAAPTISVMWDRIELGSLPSVASVVVITDGTASAVDELESTLAALAPFSDVFVIADDARGPALVARAQYLATQMEDGDPSRPIWALPIADLSGSLALMQRALAGTVAWASPAPVAEPVYVAPPVAEPVYVAPPVAEPVYVAPPVAEPVYVAPVVAAPVYVAPVVAAPVYVAPAAAPAPAAGGSALGYEQSSIYGSAIADIISQGSGKRPDAIPGQMTIACMSSKGGSGKSTTAISLAGMIARSSAAAGKPKRVVVVDLDTRDGQVGSLINQYMPTAVSIRVMPRWDAATVTANLVHDKRLGIDALLAPIRPRNADDVGPDFYKQIIQVLQTTHDLVILDCSVNYLDPLLGVGFALADEILFVTTLATTSVQGMARALTELFADPADGGLGIPRAKVGIVANQVIHNVGMGKDKLLRAALGAPLVGQIPAEHDEVLIQTNANRMDNLLKHHRLGPAYYNLATTCLPSWELAPLSMEASQAVAAPVVAEPRKRGLFGRS